MLERVANLHPQRGQIDRLGDVVVGAERIASTAVSIEP